MIENLKNLNVGEIFENIDVKKYTTYKLDGKASVLIVPDSIDNLVKLLKYLDTNGIKHKILGNGSNLIFVNKVYDGVLIKLEKLCKLEINDNIIRVGAGYSLLRLANDVSKMGLSGMEFATGIPGTVGGGVYMNAGAYKDDIASIIKEVVVLDNNYNIKHLSKNDMEFGYRHSLLQGSKMICLEAVFELKHGNVDEIVELVNQRQEKRIASQPLEFPSAGSVFRNPEGDFAGRLIEELGYKNYSIGGARVSEKHANFIINTGGATGSDIKKLIVKIKKDVKKKYNVDLYVEQEFVE